MFLQLEHEDLEKARLKAENYENQNIEYDPIIVLENVDLEQYDSFMDKYENHLRPAFIAYDKVQNQKVIGKVIIHELPSLLHDTCSFHFGLLINDAINRKSGMIGFR